MFKNDDCHFRLVALILIFIVSVVVANVHTIIYETPKEEFQESYILSQCQPELLINVKLSIEQRVTLLMMEMLVILNIYSEIEIRFHIFHNLYFIK